MIMAHRCEISGKGRQSGHRVSHAKNRTKHTFRANLQTKRIYSPELKKTVRLKVSTSMLRTIDKLGLSETLKRHNIAIESLR